MSKRMEKARAKAFAKLDSKGYVDATMELDGAKRWMRVSVEYGRVYMDQRFSVSGFKGSLDFPVSSVDSITIDGSLIPKMRLRVGRDEYVLSVDRFGAEWLREKIRRAQVDASAWSEVSNE